MEGSALGWLGVGVGVIERFRDRGKDGGGTLCDGVFGAVGTSAVADRESWFT
jgi:hypothetical protein